MREPAFLRQNKERWQENEQMLFSNRLDALNPDRLADLYIRLTDDLAYARTFYPRSQLVRYLNGLAARTHLAIYRSQRARRNRIVQFWAEDLPLALYESRMFLFYAFLWFSATFLIGAVCALQNDELLRTILGDGYVEMTLENIERGDPMGVYKSQPSFPMFVYIAANNLLICLKFFAYGLLLSAGTLYYLFVNGVMIGSFLAFFHTQDVLMEALPVVYIHGTLEISAIVLSAAAGLMLGNSLIFPGTLTRLQSLTLAARRGIKIMVSVVPVILAAAWLEGYITRLTDMPLAFKLLIILLSLLYIVGYYLVYPVLLHRRLSRTAPGPSGFQLKTA
jgi:uncharacterized membrane protein SpoIIM required for sporulation